MTATRNNRRPYKADIRNVCEEQLAASADLQMHLTEELADYCEELAEQHAECGRLRGDVGLWQESSEGFRRENNLFLREYWALLAKHKRLRIACAGLAVLAVVGWWL